MNIKKKGKETMIFKTEDRDREREIEVTVLLKGNNRDNSVNVVARCPDGFTNTIGHLKDGKFFLYTLDSHFSEMSGIVTDDKGCILIVNM